MVWKNTKLFNNVSEESQWKAWPGFESGSEANSTCQVRKLSHITRFLVLLTRGHGAVGRMELYMVDAITGNRIFH